MNRPYQSPKNRSYTLAFSLAVAFHVFLALLFFIKFSSEFQTPVTEQSVDIINAVTVNANTVNAEIQKTALEKQQQEEAIRAAEETKEKAAKEAQLAAQQKEQQKQQELQEQQEKQKLEQQKIAEAKAEKEAKAIQTKKAAEAKELLNKHLSEEQKKEAANLKQEITKQKKDKEAADIKKKQDLLDKALASELSQENQQLKAANKAAVSAKMQGELDKYKALIIEAISAEWIVPPDTTPGETCILLVTVAPDGVVLKVDIIQTSGDDFLDRSAKTAVLKASPLPVPKDGALFENFRTLRLTVKPEGIS
jgi:colicin import membrane protein